jgi:pilus assembly protein CpaF
MTDDFDITALPYFTGPDPDGVQPPDGPSPPGPAHHLLAAAAGKAAPLTPPATEFSPATTPPRVLHRLDAKRAYELSRRLDWDVITRLRGEVSDMLTTSEQTRTGLTDQDRHEIARTHIVDVTSRHVDDMVTHGGQNGTWNQETIGAVQRAVFDSLFRLGRLQPLVDLPEVENIDIYGFDNVWVSYADGSILNHDPIANSDDDLIREIQFLAARGGEGGRSFTTTNTLLDLDLPGGARLAAVHPPTLPRAAAVIRIHRFVDITLETLVEQRVITEPAAELLRAAIRAGRSIVVSGHPGAGKTTLLRALASVLDPLEKIVTIEKERELYLDQMGDRHLIVKPLQYRPGQGERLPDGTKPGEVTLVDLLEEALRLDAQRIFVGEVRGGEIDAMFQAMQAGVGSFSTLHANSPTKAIERMATLTQRNLGTTDNYAYRQIAQHINLLVQIRRVSYTDQHGIRRFRRVITDISEVQAGESVEGARPIAAPLFQAHPRTFELHPGDGRPTPELLEDLTHAGFNPRHLFGEEAA